MATLTVGNKSAATGYVAANGTLTHSHTVAAGSNRILLVKTALQEIVNTPAITGITYAGDALTAVTNSEQNTGVTWERIQWWYLITPDTGANNIVVSTAGAGETMNLMIVAADFSNHDGNAPVGNFKTYTAAGTSLNRTIARTDGDVIAVGTIEGVNTGTTTWTNATEYDDATFENHRSSTAFHTAVATGDIVITADVTVSDRFAISAVRISPLAAVPEILTVGTLSPGATVAVTYQNYSSVPLTANSTLGGVGITVSGATLSGCNITVPAESAFLFGGSLAALRFNTNTTLVLANGSETDSHTVQVAPLSSDQLAARSAAALVNPIDSYNGGLTVATNDDVYQYSSPADAFTPHPANNNFTALEPAFNLHTKFFDISAGSWSGLTTTAFPTAAPPGGGTLQISGTQLSIKPPGAVVPGAYSLTAYGDIDWIKTARTAHSTFDTKSGASVIGAPSNIGAPAWTRNEYGDPTSDALLTWTDGAELASYAGDRYVEYTQVAGAGKRWVISPGGALRKLYLWAGTYQGVGRVDVSFSDSSAGPVTYELSSLSGIYETELIEILAQPAGGAATITVDLTHVSGFSTGWAALAVGSGTPAAVYSLTSADTTVTPGQVVPLTLVGGPFAGAITAGKIVYGAVEIPFAYEIVSPTLINATIPSLDQFRPGGLCEQLPWGANFVLRLEAGSESAETPATNQVVAPGSPHSGAAGSYLATFKGRRVNSDLLPYFVRASSATGVTIEGEYETVSSGVPCFERDGGLILEAGSTNLVIQSGFAGAVAGTPGTAATSWTYISSGGTLALATSAFVTSGQALRFTATAAQHVFGQTTGALAISTTYTWSLRVTVVSGTVTYQDLLAVAAAGATPTVTARRVDGVAANATDVVSVGVHTLELCFTVASASTVSIRCGVGCNAAVTASATHDMPILEASPFATSYIPTTTAAVARAAAYVSPIPLSAMGIASQTNEYSFHFAIKMLHSSSVVNANGGGYFGVAGNTPSDRIIVYTQNVAGRLVLYCNINSAAANINLSGLTWAAGDILNIRASKGAANGLIFCVNGTTGTDTGATAKSAFATNINKVSVGILETGGIPSSAVFLGFRLYDTALTQAQLEALTTTVFDAPDGEYGIVGAPPWGYPVPNAQEGDKAYGRLVDGAGLFTPETFGFTETAPSIIEWYVFNVATQRWLAVDDVYIGYAGSTSDLYIRAIRMRSYRRLAGSYRPSRLRPWRF